MNGRRIFIDVGGERGQTIREVTGPLWAFDVVFCFEPQLAMASNLREKFSKNCRRAVDVVIVSAGLSDVTGATPLYGGGGSASIFEGKRNVDANDVQMIEVISSAEFFKKNIRQEDIVIMKLNCEGAEGRILTNLAEHGQLNKITNVMIDFDLRKIRGFRREPRRIMKMLAREGFDRYFLVDDVMLGKTHAHRIRNWLSHVPELPMFCNRAAELAASARTPPLRRRIRRFFRYL